ncbi:MAG: FAD-dependent oxidoreductase, partial [Promethearchaeota archaeon]
MESEINIYGANWCSDCRRTKKYLGEQRIHYNWYDIEKETPEGRDAYEYVLSMNKDVYGIPKRKIPVVEIIEDGKKYLLIEPSNYELAQRLGLATDVTKDFYHTIIVGAGPAGLTAAMYLARDGYDVLVIEQSTIGGQAFLTNRLDNFPGFPDGITGENFANNIKRQTERFGVQLLVPQKVISIQPCHPEGSFDKCQQKVVKTQSGQEFTCSVVLISSGSNYRELTVPGSEKLTGVNIHYCATCDGPFYKNKRLFIVGGGNSAYEEALFLKEKFADHITIIVRGNEPTVSPVLIEKVNDREGIDVWLNSEILEIIGEIQLEKILVKHKDSDDVKEYQPDGIFVFIGMSPNTKFLSGVNIDSQDFIITNQTLESSARGIFAA